MACRAAPWCKNRATMPKRTALSTHGRVTRKEFARLMCTGPAIALSPCLCCDRNTKALSDYSLRFMTKRKPVHFF